MSVAGQRISTFPSVIATLAAAVMVVAAAPGPAAGQEAADSTATLRGQVVSAMTGGPLPRAHVSLKKAGRGAFTDSAGQFTLPDLPAGRDTVEVEQIGFADESVVLQLRPGHVTEATFMLSETVLRVEDITVTVEQPVEEIGRLEGFVDRKRKGHGFFIGPEEIEERRARKPSDLLRRVPGLRVGPDGTGRRSTITVIRSQRRCEPIVWVDGQQMRDYHIDNLSAFDVLAMEVYRGPAEIPPRFMRTGGQCGVLVVWTREGKRTRDGAR